MEIYLVSLLPPTTSYYVLVDLCLVKTWGLAIRLKALDIAQTNCYHQNLLGKREMAPHEVT